MENFSKMTEQQKKKLIFFAILLTGVFSILSGLGLIIAANWDMIPPSVRIAGALTLLGLSTFVVFYGDTQKKEMLKELFLFISFFLIAGNMAVIQQVFHFDLTWNEGSSIWFALSLPYVLMSRKKILPVLSTILFSFGVWEYAVEIFERLNYLLISGFLSIVIFLTFLSSSKTATAIRIFSFVTAIIVLFFGDIEHESGFGIASILIYLISLAGIGHLLGTPEGQVRFCNYLFVFIAWRIFLLFCSAYHNLMSTGIQLVVFGGILLGVAGGYYYFFDKLQDGFRKWVSHE